MEFPEPIRKGELAGLVAPGSPVTELELRLCVDSLKALGYGVTVGSAWRKGDGIRGGYLAGSPGERAEDVNKMFQNQRVKAVFCLRGGYGTAQILKYLDYDMIKENPKILIGYSDITNLHTALQKFCGLATFHGPMVKPDMMHGMDAYSWKSMMAAFHMKNILEFENPGGEEIASLKRGRAGGVLTGGNLAVLARSCGTPHQPDADGKILFLEDVGESLQRVDMYLTQLLNAGVLKGVKGVLLGGFTECGGEAEPEEERTDDFFREWFAPFSFPVMSRIRSDHRQVMGTLPLGAECVMDAWEGKITFYRT